MENFLLRPIVFLLAPALLLSSLPGCGSTSGTAAGQEPYAQLPYADAASFSVPCEELSGALVRVLESHGYAVSLDDTSRGIIRGELTSGTLLPPEAQFAPKRGPGVLSAIGTFLSFVLLISLFAALTAHPSQEQPEAEAPGSTPPAPQSSYQYVLTTVVSATGPGTSDVSITLDRFDYLDDEVVDSSPIENKAFNYALFDALREELDRSAPSSLDIGRRNGYIAE